ncbi:hypothetical protein COCOBI_08-3200 [Coccomyxa sp. Obi]|nr:hypothetical protein COCOBI_08-3200 [Coccomyxa sp. Obi]
MDEQNSCLVDLDLSSMLNRLQAEKKSTKKHVDATKAWQQQHKEWVRAAERQTAQYDASDLPIPSALDADQLEVEENQLEEAAAEELPVHEPVFFPQQVQEPDSSFPESEPLLESCKLSIGKFGTVETDSLDISILSQEIIYGGWLTQYYRRRPDCPEETAKVLFRLAAFSRNESVAAASCSTLLELLGVPDCKDAFLASARTSIPYESALYGSSPSVRVTEWAPGANDILDALTQLGYKPAQPSATGRQTKKNAAKADTLPAPQNNSTQPQLLNVVLLLRLLKAVCQAKEATGGAQGPAWSNHAELVAALLRLRMDPQTCSLAQDLESATHAALQAFGDSTWERKFGGLVEQASQVGCGHRGHLEAIERIPTTSARGRLLRQHALVALLRRIIPSKAKGAPSYASKRGAVADVDVPKALQSMSWFVDARGTRAMAASAMSADADSSFGAAEVHTALQAAHKLVWEHEVKHGRDDFVKDTWHGFLKSLEAQFLTSKKLDRMSDLKLLFTALLNFTPVDQI